MYMNIYLNQVRVKILLGNRYPLFLIPFSKADMQVCPVIRSQCGKMDWIWHVAQLAESLTSVHPAMT